MEALGGWNFEQGRQMAEVYCIREEKGRESKRTEENGREGKRREENGNISKFSDIRKKKLQPSALYPLPFSLYPPQYASWLLPSTLYLL
ncbi:MAG: hypothetical protein ACHBN1_11275 [Heteroscytonema crispum UTEX LB 1556]